MKREMPWKVTFLLLLTLFVCESPLFPQERFRKTPPYPEPLAELKLPEINSGFLSNGLALSVIHRENLPIISLRMIIFAGESSSPEKLPGMATLVTRMLSLGALNLSSSEIEETIESIGGTFSTSTYPDYSVFDFTFLEQYLDDALGLLSKMILYPTFKKIEIDNAKRTMTYELIAKKIDTEFLARRQIYRLLFKDHPYERSLYNEDVIKNLNQKDLLSFYDNYYRPNNACIILTGKLNLPTASRIVSRYLGRWQEREVNHPFLQPPSPNDKKKICLVNLPEDKEATIYMGNVVLPASSEDVFPFFVLNQVLGGTTNSRLLMNLRESKGYAYWAFSEVEFFKNFGLFFVKAKVRPEFVYKSIEEALNEIKIVANEEIPSFEIEQAKSYLIGNFPLQIETYDSLSSKVSDFKVFNLGEEHWTRYYENIMLVNSQKVFETARKYALPAPIVVIVGDQKIIIDYISEFDEIEIYDTRGILKQTIKKGESQ